MSSRARTGLGWLKSAIASSDKNYSDQPAPIPPPVLTPKDSELNSINENISQIRRMPEGIYNFCMHFYITYFNKYNV